jgi:hypothetical protein
MARGLYKHNISIGGLAPLPSLSLGSDTAKNIVSKITRRANSYYYGSMARARPEILLM